MRLDEVARSAIQSVERELGISIIGSVVPDQKNLKYNLQIAGARPLEFRLRDTASDAVITADIRARLIAHFRKRG